MDIDVENLVDPINDDAPCGEFIRYEAEFELLEEEVQKLGGISSNTIDWKKVVDQSTQILVNESKDLLIVAYLCYGLFKIEEYSGLNKGLTALKGIVEQHWDGLFPPKKRMRGRIGAVEWLSEKLSEALSSSEVKLGDEDTCFACMESIVALDILFNEKFNGESSALLNLSRTIKGIVDNLPEKEEKTQVVAEVVASVSKIVKPVPRSVASDPAIETGDVATGDDALKVIMEAGFAIRKIIPVLREKDPPNPASYRFLKIFSWMEITSLPTVQNGNTLIQPPPAQIKNIIVSQFEGSNWPALLDTCEANLFERPLWLDLAVYSSRALEAMGPAYKDAADVSKMEIALFLKKLPDLVEYNFKDGSPFLSDDNKIWVEGNVLNESAGGGESVALSSQETSERLNEIQKETKDIIGMGDFLKALNYFKGELNTVSAFRERFLWEVELAKICIGAGEYRLALPILEALEETIEKHILTQWEPQLSFEVFGMLWKIYIKVPSKSDINGVYQAKLESLYARMCRIDFSKAYEMLSKKKKSGFF